jgi:hypothetical protein
MTVGHNRTENVNRPTYNDPVIGGSIVAWFKTVVILLLLAILFSLGNAIFHLTGGKGDPGKTVRALTWRIGLSIALLLVLLLAAHQGWITPHGIGH